MTGMGLSHSGAWGLLGLSTGSLVQSQPCPAPRLCIVQMRAHTARPVIPAAALRLGRSCVRTDNAASLLPHIRALWREPQEGDSPSWSLFFSLVCAGCTTPAAGSSGCGWRALVAGREGSCPCGWPCYCGSAALVFQHMRGAQREPPSPRLFPRC